MKQPLVQASVWPWSRLTRVSHEDDSGSSLTELQTVLRWLLSKWAKLPWACWQESQMSSWKGEARGP